MKNFFLAPFALWLGFALTALAQAQPLVGPVHRFETATQVGLANGRFALAIDKATGQWASFKPQGGPEMLAAPARPDFALDGEWQVARHGAKLLGYHVRVDGQRRGAVLETVLGITPELELTCAYFVPADGSPLRQTAKVVYRPGPENAARPRQFGGFRLALPGWRPGPEAACTVDVPGPFFPQTFVPPAAPYAQVRAQVAQSPGGQLAFHSAPDAGFGLLVASAPGLSVGTWVDTGGEVNYRPSLLAEGGYLVFGHDNYRQYLLRGAMSVESDPYLCATAPDLPGVLAAYRQVVEATLPLAPRTPAWVREMVLLEVYPDYFKGGFKEIAQQLAFYRQVGFNTVYLMPHWRGGYSPIDLFAVEPKYGTEADLKALVQTAHGLGMKVLFDMVIHGMNEASPLPGQRPDLFIRQGDTLARHPTWRSVSTDWAAPAYQAYMRALVEHDLATYDIDGYRVDAASYKGANWDPALPYPAYRSGTAAPELMDTMLVALQRRKPKAALLSEVFGPVFYRVCNLAHDNQTEAITLLIEKMGRGEYAFGQYQAHLANVLDLLPAGANRVFFGRNHDTSWFYRFLGYTPTFMAFEGVHAFFGLPEAFAGDPNHGPHPTPAVWEQYRRLLAWRQTLPELARGRPRLRDVRADQPEVFAGVKQGDQHASLVLINGGGRACTATVTLPPDLATRQLILTDVFTGQEVYRQAAPTARREWQVPLGPHQQLVGRVK